MTKELSNLRFSSIKPEPVETHIATTEEIEIVRGLAPHVVRRLRELQTNQSLGRVSIPNVIAEMSGISPVKTCSAFVTMLNGGDRSSLADAVTGQPNTVTIDVSAQIPIGQGRLVTFGQLNHFIDFCAEKVSADAQIQVPTSLI